MIRGRLPKTDDRIIRNIIVKELIPVSAKRIPASETTLRKIKKRLRRGTTFVMTGKKRVPVGFVTAIASEKTLYVDMLAVNTKAQRRGIGAALLEKAETFGKKRGCTIAVLYVDRDNDKAMQFYQKNGYTARQFISQVQCFHFSKEIS